MSKMNPNEKKENASKNENVNNEEATNFAGRTVKCGR